MVKVSTSTNFVNQIPFSINLKTLHSFFVHGAMLQGPVSGWDARARATLILHEFLDLLFQVRSSFEILNPKTRYISRIFAIKDGHGLRLSWNNNIFNPFLDFLI